MNNPNIYCIVVTYNGRNWIDKCFGSLLETTIPLKIFCIDNGSEDDTVEYLRTNYPCINIIETGSNLGFGRANNIGLRIALEEKADYVFLLNQDAWVQSGCIKNIISSYKDNPNAGLISPIHLNGKGDNFNIHFSVYCNENYCPGFYSDAFFNRKKKLYQTKFVNAAAWMLSIKTIEEIGGFDPLFPHYGEDLDYIERLHLYGLDSFICTDAFIHHDTNEISNEEYSKLADQLVIQHMVQLKKVTNSYKSNWLTFLKSEFDIQTTMLLFRKFRNWKFRYKGAVKMFRLIRKINQARQNSLKRRAFLS